MTITKQHLAELIAERAGVSAAKGWDALDGVLDAIGGEIARGGEVSIRGFGSFTRRRQKGGTGRNLHTGEAITYPESLKPHFAPGKAFKDRVKAAV